MILKRLALLGALLFLFQGEAFSIPPKNLPTATQPAQKVVKKVVKVIFIKRTELDKSLEPASIVNTLQSATVVPYYSENKLKGLKFLKIAAGSLFDQLGFKNEDIWVRINEKEIEVVGSLEWLMIMKNNNRFELELVRAGQPILHRIIVK